MVIYVDVLVFLNTVVDYLLIRLTSKMAGYTLKSWRAILGALAAALFSLSVFLPQLPVLPEIGIRLAASVLGVAIAFGFGSLKKFTVNLLIFYAVSFVYAGVMMGIYMVSRPKVMSINNGVVYFDISALTLITASLVFYIIMTAARKLMKRNCKDAGRCQVCLYFYDKYVTADAIIDTGHSLFDAFDGSVVIIIDRFTSKELFGENDTDNMVSLIPPGSGELQLRFRVSPVKTVSGERLMPAVKIDKAIVGNGRKKYTIEHPVVVISNDSLGSDYSVIIPPAAVGA